MPSGEESRTGSEPAVRVQVLATATADGGAEAYLTRLYAGLAELGVTATLVGSVPGWAGTGLAAVPVGVGPKWSRSSAVESLRRLRNDRAAYLRGSAGSAAAAAAGAPRLHHVQYKREQVLLTAALAERAPVLWTEHGRLGTTGPHRLVRAGYRQAARHAAAVVCVSDDVASDVRAATQSSGGAPEVVTIRNAVDTDVFRPPDPARRAALRAAILPASWQERPVAVLASRLHPAKGHDRALALAQHLGLPLVVVGDGPDRARLEALGRRGETVFLGQRADVPDILAACDVYLFAGAKAEGTPFAVLEAAATGLLLVGFRGDEGARTVTDCGGVLVDRADAAPAGLASLVARPEGRGSQARDFVLTHHDRRGWLTAHAELIRRLAR